MKSIIPSKTAPDDFLSRTFITIFPASSSASGGSRQDIQVVIVNDNVFEANETFLVRTTDNNQCSDPAQNSVVVTIKDDDAREYTNNLNNNNYYYSSTKLTAYKTTFVATIQLQVSLWWLDLSPRKRQWQRERPWNHASLLLVELLRVS